MMLPSDKDLKKFGKILFFLLILPALCYYTFQGLKTLFAWVKGCFFEPTEERTLLIRQEINDDQNSPREQIEGYELYCKVNDDDQQIPVESDINLEKHSIGSIKNTLSEFLQKPREQINKFAFFKKTLKAPGYPKVDDPTPDEKNIHEYIKVNVTDMHRNVFHTYYFQLVLSNDSNFNNNDDTICLDDKVETLNQKVLKKLGKPPTLELFFSPSNNRNHLNSNETIGYYKNYYKMSNISLSAKIPRTLNEDTLLLSVKCVSPLNS